MNNVLHRNTHIYVDIVTLLGYLNLLIGKEGKEVNQNYDIRLIVSTVALKSRSRKDLFMCANLH